MILNCDFQKPVYIVGDGVVVHELQQWISLELKNILFVAPGQFSSVPKNSQCMLGFWNIDYRIKFLETWNIKQYQWPIYIHPQACVNTLDIGEGSIIYPLAFIGHGTKIGPFGLVGQFSSLGHGSTLGSNNVLSPNTIIGGSTHTGDHLLFGQKTSIKDKLVLGSNIKFFMNSLVSKSISHPGSYFGNKKVPQ